jgi:hypothetical protein
MGGVDGVGRVQGFSSGAGSISGSPPARESTGTEQNQEIPQRGDGVSISDSSSDDRIYESFLRAQANDSAFKEKNEKMEAKLVLSDMLTDTINHRVESGEQLSAGDLRQMRLEANQLESKILEGENPKNRTTL